MVILLTATVCPDNKMTQLHLRESEKRLTQYQEAIRFYLTKTNVEKIVLCDNSGVSQFEFDQQKTIAMQKGKRLEIVSFVGDQNKILQKGKGYGEGEIIKYALDNSLLLKNETEFIKITGRLVVNNIDELVRGYKGRPIFNRAEHTEPNRVDTRLFMISMADFKQYFENEYVNVYDEKGIYLEQVYYECIVKYKIHIGHFAAYPRISGCSGSTGSVYGYKEWKCRIKDLLEVAGYYTPNFDTENRKKYNGKKSG